VLLEFDRRAKLNSALISVHMEGEGHDRENY